MEITWYLGAQLLMTSYYYGNAFYLLAEKDVDVGGLSVTSVAHAGCYNKVVPCYHGNNLGKHFQLQGSNIVSIQCTVGHTRLTYNCSMTCLQSKFHSFHLSKLVIGCKQE